MGEGFGDYLAATFFAERKPELMKPTVGNWDAVAYSGDEPPNLRRLDSTKKYPRDMQGERACRRRDLVCLVSGNSQCPWRKDCRQAHPGAPLAPDTHCNIRAGCQRLNHH